MKEQIANYINRYLKFDDNELDELYGYLTPKTYGKKEYILREGEICRHNFFIVKGLTRTFYIDTKGNEQVMQFGVENWWVTNTESFTKTTPSKLYIQALETTTVLKLSKTNLDTLYVTIPKLERLFRIITENMLIAIQRKSEVYMKMSSKDRYEFLTKEIPGFVQRVPQYMIASYLEITPEYLSALRKLKE